MTQIELPLKRVRTDAFLHRAHLPTCRRALCHRRPFSSFTPAALAGLRADVSSVIRLTQAID
ncbi:MAG TPA: hypothetical protein VHG29_10660 [Novosphingobium sp.]|nr:hypothetical protein [Novosphingobium sp.]